MWRTGSVGAGAPGPHLRGPWRFGLGGECGSALAGEVGTRQSSGGVAAGSSARPGRPTMTPRRRKLFEERSVYSNMRSAQRPISWRVDHMHARTPAAGLALSRPSTRQLGLTTSSSSGWQPSIWYLPEVFQEVQPVELGRPNLCPLCALERKCDGCEVLRRVAALDGVVVQASGR